MINGVKWFILCAVLAAGEALAFVLPYFSPAWFIAFIFTIITALLAFGYDRRNWFLVSLFLLGTTLGWITLDNRMKVLLNAVELNRGRPIEARFTIPSSVKCFEEKKGLKKVVFPAEINGVDVTVNIYFNADTVIPDVGERWCCKGWMGRSSNGGVFGRRRFWVRGKGSSAYLEKKCDNGNFLNRIVDFVRSDVSKRIGIGLDRNSEIENLNRALLLGDKSGIDREMKEAFANSGTAHLFAVSGLHVFVITKFFSIILSLTGFSARFKALPLIPLVWLFVLVVGAGPSSVRAGVMATFYLMAPLFWRKSDSLSAWAQTFLLLHILQPENLVNTGSQLSFVVMLGLVLWNRIASGHKSRLVNILAPSLVAWVFGVPIIAATFSVITPAGLWANFLAVPLACFSVVLSATGVLFSYISNILAGPVNAAAHMTTSIMVGLARTAGASGLSNFEVEKWGFAECALWYGAVAIAMWLFYFNRSRRTVKF